MSFFKRLFKFKRATAKRVVVPKNKVVSKSSAGEVCDFPNFSYLIAGKPGEGKTTLLLNLVQYFKERFPDYRVVGPKSITVKAIVEAKRSIIAIDDFETSVSKYLLVKIRDSFRVIRHNRNVLIITYHNTNFPGRFVELFDKIILMNLSKRPAKNSNLFNVVTSDYSEILRDVVISLRQGQYVVCYRGKLYGPYDVSDVRPIVGEPNPSHVITSATATEVSDDPRNYINVRGIPLTVALELMPRYIIFAELYNQGLKTSAIAKLMGVSLNTISTYRARAKLHGLIQVRRARSYIS